MIFSLLIFSSHIISLIATPIRHSLSTHLQSVNYSHPQPQLEKRGGSVSSRSSSCYSLESESASPPDAPILKTANIEEDREQGQKRKGVRSDDQRLKDNKARRVTLARINRALELDPIALKAKRLKIKKASARRWKKREVLFDANPAAKTAWKLKIFEANARCRQKKRRWLEANPKEMKVERKKIAERDSMA
jgi:hypothetical protein